MQAVPSTELMAWPAPRLDFCGNVMAQGYGGRVEEASTTDASNMRTAGALSTTLHPQSTVVRIYYPDGY